MSDITLDEARAIAAGLIDETFETDEGPIQIVDDETLTTDIGWVFSYESQVYLESGDFSSKLVGNAPVLVTPLGYAVFTGTAHPLEDYLQMWREALRVTTPPEP